jgi:hypothetical protein
MAGLERTFGPFPAKSRLSRRAIASPIPDIRVRFGRGNRKIILGSNMDVYQTLKCVMLVVCLSLLATTVVSAVPPLGQIDFQVVHPPHSPLVGQPAYFTVRSKEQWLEWWNAKVTERLPASTPEQPAQSIQARPPPPDIDFEHSILIVASSGAKLGTGNSIAFIAIFRIPSGIVASVQETAQRGSCVISTAVSIPVAIALIPRTDEAIRFRVASAESDCANIKTIDSQVP